MIDAPPHWLPPAPPPVDAPPAPPPTYPYGFGPSPWVWPATSPPPPAGRPRSVIVAAMVAVAALVVVLPLTAAALSRNLIGSHPAAGSPFAMATPSSFAGPAAQPSPEVGNVPTALPAIPAGTLTDGGAAQPIAWVFGQDQAMSVTPAHGGVQLQLPDRGLEYWSHVPVSQGRSAERSDADVRLVSGPDGDAVGIGCRSADGSAHYGFVLMAGGYWAIRSETAPIAVLREGVSSAPPRLYSGVHLSAACITTGTVTELIFAVNGSTIAATTVAAPPATLWEPTLELCSCGGPDVATYTGFTESSLDPTLVPDNPGGLPPTTL